MVIRDTYRAGHRNRNIGVIKNVNQYEHLGVKMKRAIKTYQKKKKIEKKKNNDKGMVFNFVAKKFSIENEKACQAMIQYSYVTIGCIITWYTFFFLSLSTLAWRLVLINVTQDLLHSILL